MKTRHICLVNPQTDYSDIQVEFESFFLNGKDFWRVSKFDTTNPLDESPKGFTGLKNERLVIFVDTYEEYALEKLYALLTFLDENIDNGLLRLTGEFMKRSPEVSIVFNRTIGKYDESCYDDYDEISTYKVFKKIAECNSFVKKVLCYGDYDPCTRFDKDLYYEDDDSRTYETTLEVVKMDVLPDIANKIIEYAEENPDEKLTVYATTDITNRDSVLADQLFGLLSEKIEPIHFAANTKDTDTVIYLCDRMSDVYDDSKFWQTIEKVTSDKIFKKVIVIALSYDEPYEVFTDHGKATEIWNNIPETLNYVKTVYIPDIVSSDYIADQYSHTLPFDIELFRTRIGDLL